VPNIFLSYAQQDSPLVTRVFEDLSRARIGDVWCYEITSEYGADFRHEYAEKISSAHIFILFDSPYARASRYVRHEVDLCRNTPGTKLLICCAVSTGTWREDEIFAGQNRIVYFEFTDYENGIRSLCNHLQSSYVPRFTMPRDIEFEGEVRASIDCFPLEQRQSIFDKYAFFRSMLAHDPPAAEAQLVVLVRQHLDAANARVISPMLALGALRNEANRYKEAEQAFRLVTARSPDDPRGWAGRAIALFGQDRYLEAAEEWEMSLTCIQRANDTGHRQYEGEIRHNAARALFEAGAVKLAWQRLGPSIERADTVTEDLILAGKILLKLDDHRAPDVLAEAARRASGREMIQSDLYVDLAECLRQIGEHSLVGQVTKRALELYPLDADIMRQCAVYEVWRCRFDVAVRYYQKALRIDPANVRCTSELALLSKKLGVPNGWQKLVQDCLNSQSLSPTNEYYLGLAHFLDGREETARYFHSRSRQSDICANWPYYSELAR
jgi:tetratricopeptide (TPR) repeat protein